MVLAVAWAIDRKEPRRLLLVDSSPVKVTASLCSGCKPLFLLAYDVLFWERWFAFLDRLLL